MGSDSEKNGFGQIWRKFFVERLMKNIFLYHDLNEKYSKKYSTPVHPVCKKIQRLSHVEGTH